MNELVLEMKELRKSLGWTQSFFAMHFDIPLRTVESWERGIRVPPTWALLLLIKELQSEKNKKENHTMY